MASGNTYTILSVDTGNLDGQGAYLLEINSKPRRTVTVLKRICPVTPDPGMAIIVVEGAATYLAGRPMLRQ